MKTRTISGVRLTLKTGIQYRASRPFYLSNRSRYDVTIERLHDSGFGSEVLTIRDLTFDRAAALVDAFNNGPSSFDGRIW